MSQYEDADLTLSIHTESARITMNSLGDVNGDGLSDLAVGVGSGSTAIPGGMIVTCREVQETSISKMPAPLVSMAPWPSLVSPSMWMAMEPWNLAGPDHLYRFTSFGRRHCRLVNSTTARLGPQHRTQSYSYQFAGLWGLSPVAIVSAGALMAPDVYSCSNRLDRRNTARRSRTHGGRNRCGRWLERVWSCSRPKISRVAASWQSRF